MAQGGPHIDVTFKCATDLSAKQYYAVILSADNTVAIATAAAKVIGVLQNKPDGTAGENAVVRVFGVSKHVLGENLTYGEICEAKSDGTGEQLDADASWGYCMILHGASSGETATVFVNPGMGAAGASDA